MIKLYNKIKLGDEFYVGINYSDNSNYISNYYRKNISTKYTRIKHKKSNTEIIDFKKYYKKKRYITTKSEGKFYSELLKICKKYNLILLTQVALYELVEVNLDKKSKDYIRYFNKIKSKTIDFVVVDEETTRIRLCIELDDYTHKYKSRIERDNFINELFKQLEINFIRINSSYNCNYEQLEGKIKNICTDQVYSQKNS